MTFEAHLLQKGNKTDLRLHDAIYGSSNWSYINPILQEKKKKKKVNWLQWIAYLNWHSNLFKHLKYHQSGQNRRHIPANPKSKGWDCLLRVAWSGCYPCMIPHLMCPIPQSLLQMPWVDRKKKSQLTISSNILFWTNLTQGSKIFNLIFVNVCQLTHIWSISEDNPSDPTTF